MQPLAKRGKLSHFVGSAMARREVAYDLCGRDRDIAR
jgi:hypothetical protein